MRASGIVSPLLLTLSVATRRRDLESLETGRHGALREDDAAPQRVAACSLVLVGPRAHCDRRSRRLRVARGGGGSARVPALGRPRRARPRPGRPTRAHEPSAAAPSAPHLARDPLERRPAWPVAVAHGVGMGTDNRTWWRCVTILCLAVVGAGVVWRLYEPATS
jgi:hypothetical protein